MKSTSNYIVYVVAVVVVLAFTFNSCKDQFDINVLRESPKMVVYCFPSTADTTFINVSRSIPVQQKKIADEVKAINNARISYRINRQEQVVRQKRSGQYYVTSLQRPGDQIDLAISADGIGSVYASTTIPKEVPIAQLKMQEVRRYDYESGRAQKYIQMQPTFTACRRRVISEKTEGFIRAICRLKLPLIQRGFVWKSTRKTNLCSSLCLILTAISALRAGRITVFTFSMINRSMGKPIQCISMSVIGLTIIN